MEKMFWVVIATVVGSSVCWLFIFYLFTRCCKKRKSKVREIKFTLPDRENTFVRSRLSTDLNSEFCKAQENEKKLAIEFSQALKMLDKILVAPLSTAEKIEAGQIQSDLFAFENKERFSAKDVSSINENFLRLLKLSAKYGV